MKKSRTEVIARRIYRTIRGYDAKQMREDERDFGEYQRDELRWLMGQLRQVPEALLLDELEKKK